MARKHAQAGAVPSTHPLASQAVYGLAGGRSAARRTHRWRRLRNRVSSFVMMVVLAAAVGGGAWVGYSMYEAHQANEDLEREQKHAEFLREHSGEDVGDVIDDLNVRPKWNGPGNPTFGVGDEP